MPVTEVRVAVVGAGGMGANHARVLAGLKGVRLVAVVDTDPARAEAVASAHGTLAQARLEDVIGDIDAATVAVPSSLHGEVAGALLTNGIHCLVEKPLATSEAEGEALVAAAATGGAKLLVGHIERFNPAVRQLRDIVRHDHRVLAVEARRMSAVSRRITDVDVVADLMVHDIDIVLDLVGQPVVEVVARGVADQGAVGDYVTALLRFADGTLASLTASRITQNQIRELQVTTDSRFLTVDYSNQELLIFRQGRIDPIDGPGSDASRYVLDVGTERVFVRRTEPLVVELQHFVEVARGQAEPLVTGEQAVQALKIVRLVQEQIHGADHG